jgi:hypothetical protein
MTARHTYPAGTLTRFTVESRRLKAISSAIRMCAPSMCGRLPAMTGPGCRFWWT